MNSNNNLTDASSADLSMYIMDMSGDMMDISEDMMDMSGNMMDISEDIVNMSGDIMDISGDYLNEALLSRSVTSSFVNRLIDTIDNSIENAVSREISILEEPVYKKVLTQEGESNLKKIKFKDSEKKNQSCPILFIEFDEEEDIIELNCKHCFNESAIKKWLTEEKSECPVCRYVLPENRWKKIDMPEVSRDEIRNDIRLSYLNNINERITETYDRASDIEMQRILLQQYE